MIKSHDAPGPANDRLERRERKRRPRRAGAASTSREPQAHARMGARRERLARQRAQDLDNTGPRVTLVSAVCQDQPPSAQTQRHLLLRAGSARIGSDGQSDPDGIAIRRDRDLLGAIAALHDEQLSLTRALVRRRPFELRSSDEYVVLAEADVRAGGIGHDDDLDTP